MLDALDAGAVRGWCRCAADALRRARGDIDALNVFPVPDGDTGTNLHLTMEAVAAAVESPDGGLVADRTGTDAGEPASELGDDPAGSPVGNPAGDAAGDAAGGAAETTTSGAGPAVAGGALGETHSAEGGLAATWQAAARGALLGARGNSGVILSQVWRGLAEVLPDAAPCRGRALGTGLRHAASRAYAAVERPAEGTVLSVLRAAGDAAADCETDDLGAAARAAAEGARAALHRTTGQLDILARAGVVDAGGAGLCVILDALVATVSGEPAEPVPPPGPRAPEPTASRAPVSRLSADLAPPAGPAYEVMYLLDATEDALPNLRARLDELGDSLLVVGGERLWNVHVHVDDAGAAIEAGIEAGRPHRIRVTSLRPEVTLAGASGRGVVAVVSGEGAASLFAEAGATVLRRDTDRGPTVGELLEATRRAGDEVAVLPNDSGAHTVAEGAAMRAREDDRHVSVLPTRATVQGLAALAVHDPHRRFDDDVIAMTAAGGATRFGEVTVAAGPAVTSAGICQAGDVLGLIEGDVAVIGPELGSVAVDVVDRMLAGAGGELVTLVTGEGPTAPLEGALREHLRVSRPDVDCVVYAGGQPICPLLIGVE